MASGNSPTKSAKTYMDHVVESNKWAWWTVASLCSKLTQMQEQRVTVESPYCNFWKPHSWQCCCVEYFTNVSILLQFWFTIYPLLISKIADMTMLYFHKVFKNLIIVSITSVNLLDQLEIFCVHFWQTILE